MGAYTPLQQIIKYFGLNLSIYIWLASVLYIINNEEWIIFTFVTNYQQYMYMYMYMYMHMHMRMYMYMHMHVHMHIHMYMYMDMCEFIQSIYRQSQVRKPNGSEVKWAECS